MTQLEKQIENYLNKNPHVKIAYTQGLINRRALARKIIETDRTLSKNQFEATIAVLRRIELPDSDNTTFQSGNFSILIKDGITIANLAKTKDSLSQIQKILPKISYEKNQTFKLVMGSESVKVFLDSANKGLIDVYIQKKDILYVHEGMAEISLSYPQEASTQKGILSYLTASLAMRDISVEEFLTCSPELILYVGQKDALKTYETLKSMQK